MNSTAASLYSTRVSIDATSLLHAFKVRRIFVFPRFSLFLFFPTAFAELYTTLLKLVVTLWLALFQLSTRDCSREAVAPVRVEVG